MLAIEDELPDLYKVSQKEINLILERAKQERMKDVIEFEEIRNSSQLFWYSPVPNLAEKEQQLNTLKLSHLQFLSNMTTDNKTLLSVNNGLSKKDMVEMNFVNVPIESQRISLTRHREKNGGTTPAKNNEQIVIESGECNIKFRFRLISIERINVLFDEIREQISTNNLETTPRNVTLDPKKVRNTQKKGFSKLKSNQNKHDEEELEGAYA